MVGPRSAGAPKIENAEREHRASILLSPDSHLVQRDPASDPSAAGEAQAVQPSMGEASGKNLTGPHDGSGGGGEAGEFGHNHHGSSRSNLSAGRIPSSIRAITPESGDAKS
jgi:hypothetical protein